MFLAASLFVAILLYVVYHVLKGSSIHDSGIPARRSWWYVGTPEFFWDPFRFIEESMEWAKGAMFSFKVLNNTVVVLRGIPGRNAFFSKGLDFMSGYRLLNPQLVDVMPVNEISGDESWASFMGNFLRSEVLSRMFPIMVQDVSSKLDTWGDRGEANPFKNVYEIVFVLGVRIATCKEFADDPKLIRRLMKIFDRLEAGSKPTSVLLPWVPTPSRMGRLFAGGELYQMIKNVVEARKREGRREDDPLQALIDKNFSLVDITRFVAMTLFAAVTNTGNVLCWVFVYLEANPTWKAKVQSEIDLLVRDNCPAGASDVSSWLAAMSIEELDKATDILDMCIHETIRMIFIGTLMRRNIGDDIYVSGRRIPHGAFLMFPTQDLHFDPTFYPNPNVFDPTRFTAEATAARQANGITFLGWGASRHVCVGRRSALVMMKTAIVLIMSRFHTDVSYAKGGPVRQVPSAFNDVLFKVCPPGPQDEVHLRYRSKSGKLSQHVDVK